MKENITGIVLGTIKHSDKHNVTSIYTRERGRMAFLTPAGASRSSRQTIARLQPMSIIEAQANISPTRNIHNLTSIVPKSIWRTIYYDPLKSTVALFISEFLSRLLREAPAEARLWDFIFKSIRVLDATENRTAAANFHITFLISMSYMMGIQPDLSDYREGMEFDMKTGIMVYPFNIISPNSLRIDSQRARFLPMLTRINYANARHFHFSGKERSEIIDGILKYYGLHFPGSDNLKSLDILKEIFK
ncbi:MAG: DNA repair protein RecO C-terminal domain-containing protein [Muribaculaceae bacterium]|nr:DNA repair protein RecO C-terminal domain-containing protein [Muribaculaceae bacterium]